MLHINRYAVTIALTWHRQKTTLARSTTSWVNEAVYEDTSTGRSYQVKLVERLCVMIHTERSSHYDCAQLHYLAR